MKTTLNLKKVDVFEFLNDLGLQHVKKDGNEVKFSCPFGVHHRGGAVSMQQGTTIYNCFGCGSKGNAITFLVEYEGLSPTQAKTFLREKFDIYDDIDEENFLSQVNKKLDRIEKKRNKEYEEIDKSYPILSEEEIYKREVNWRTVADHDGKTEFSYLIDRGFTVETLDEWEIGWDSIEQMFTIPYMDEEGNLVGFKGRAIEGNLPRYKVIGGDEFGFEPCLISNFLFGLDRVLAARHTRIIVTEGELNAMAMHQSGIKNVVGISGNSISERQRELILKHCNYVAFRFDDPNHTRIAVRQFRDFIPVGYFKHNEKDPADMKHNERMKLVSTIKSGLLL